MKSRFVVTGLIVFVIVAVVAIESCRKKENWFPTPIVLANPIGWPGVQYNFGNNPLTQQGFDLGRKLFYDAKLSKDGNFPCSSCHQQAAAFGTFDHDRSHGYNNAHTLRNAPALQNLAWKTQFDWDGAFSSIEQRILAHINHPGEMGENTADVLTKLRSDATYPALFNAAFGDENIDADRLSKALAQFVLMLVSSNSKYDKVMRGEATFNLPEQTGYDVFKSKCTGCHKEPLTTDFTYRNIGLRIDPALSDFGRMRVTNNKGDSLKFQVPSLRNVQLTYTYGHDGRFFVIDNVLEHYRSGVQSGPTTDPLVTNYIPLSNFEIGQLKAFLYALTDSSIVKDPRFSKP
jgi:cytochrome c peroxidase